MKAGAVSWELPGAAIRCPCLCRRGRQAGRPTPPHPTHLAEFVGAAACVVRLRASALPIQRGMQAAVALWHTGVSHNGRAGGLGRC